MKTQKEVRKAFWQFLKVVDPNLYAKGKRSKRQNDQVTDIRCSFVQWLDGLHRDGQINDKQVNTYTL